MKRLLLSIRIWELAFTNSFFASSNLPVPGIHINIYTLHHSLGYLFSLVHFAQWLSFAAWKLTRFVADINLHEVYLWELRKWRFWGSHAVGAGGILGDEKSCASFFWKRCLLPLLRSLIYLDAFCFFNRNEQNLPLCSPAAITKRWRRDDPHGPLPSLGPESQGLTSDVQPATHRELGPCWESLMLWVSWNWRHKDGSRKLIVSCTECVWWARALGRGQVPDSPAC